MKRAILLGLRLARPRSRSQWMRLGLGALGSAGAVFALLTLLAVPNVVDGQAERLGGQSVDRIETRSIQEWAAPAPLRASRSEEFLHGRSLTRIAVASARPDAAIPSWLERYPKPGELAASPALVELIERQPAGASRRFPQRIIQVLPAEALISPDQLLAIVGVAGSELEEFGTVGPARGIGLEDDVHQGPGRGVIRVLATAGTVLVGVPAIVLIVASARLSARIRERRLAALRLTGLTPAMVGAVNAVEIAVSTITGVTLGLVAWLGTRSVWATGQLGPTHWFNSDADLGPVELAGTGVVVVALGATASWVASRRAVRAPLDERASNPPPPLRAVLRAIPLGVGIATLIACSIWNQPTNSWFFAFAAGNLIAGTGLYLALPVIARATGAVLASQSERQAVLLAGRRLRFEPNAIARTTASVLALVLVTGFAQILTGVLDWATTRNNLGLAADIPVIVTVRNAPLDEAAFDTIPGVEQVLPIVTFDLADGDTTDALIASCAQLDTLTTSTTTGCDDASVQPIFGSPDLRELPLGEPIEALVVNQNGATGAPAGLRLHPDLVPASAKDPHSWLVELDSTDANETFMNHVIGAAPAAGFNGPPSPDRGRQLATYETLVTAASRSALVLLSVAAAMTIIDRTLERRRTSNQLLALGLPASTLRRSEALAIAAPLTAGVTAATIVAAVSGIAYLRLGFDQFSFPSSELATAFATGLLAAAVVAASAAAATPATLRGRIESDA